MAIILFFLSAVKLFLKPELISKLKNKFLITTLLTSALMHIILKCLIV